VSLALPALLFVAATLGMALLVEPFLAWYYQWAWWSYVLAADGLNRRLAGRSLLRDEPRRFLWLAGVSVALWTFFEALNLRLGNWYYVMDHPLRAVRWAGDVAFATVARARRDGGPAAPPRCPPPRAGPGCAGAARRTLGLRTVASPASRCLSPGPIGSSLTWASFIFLLEPWNWRHARRAPARARAGRGGPDPGWLLAGLACGLLWGTCNY
jgi:hypothetical protein